MTRRPASLPRVQVGASSPASSVLSGRYDFLPLLPPRFVAFAWRYHPSARVSPGPRPSAAVGGLRELVTRYLQPGSCRWKRQDLLRSWGTPIVLLPCSPTPVGPTHQAIQCVGAAPAVSTAKAPAFVLSRLNHTASALAVYASQAGSPRHHARLASGCWPSSSGRAWLPAGFQRKVSRCILHGSSFPKLNVAQGRHIGQRSSRSVSFEPVPEGRGHSDSECELWQP